MSTRGELDLNQILPPPAPPLPPHPAAELWGSVKEALRQTMLEHEIVFKHQVRELHRLYWTQKNLMDEVALEIKEKNPNNIQSPFPMLQGNSFDSHIYGQNNTNLLLPLYSFAGGFGRDVTGSRYSELKDFPACQSKAVLEPLEIDCSTSDINGGRSRQNARCFIDLEAPLEMNLNQVPNVEASLGCNTLEDNAADASRSEVAALFDISPSQTQDNSLNHSAEEDSSVARQREKQTKETSTVSFADFQKSGLLCSVNQPRQKQQQSRSINLNIDLNVAQDDKPTNSSDTPKAFSSPSASSSLVLVEMWRESSSKSQIESDLSDACPKRSKTVVPALVVRGSENMFPGPSKDNLPSSRQVSEESTKVEENSWKHEESRVDNVVDKFGSESMISFCRQPIERCLSSPNKASKRAENKMELGHRGGKFCSSNANSSNEIEVYCVHASAESNILLSRMVEDTGEDLTQESEDTVSSCIIASYEENQDEKGKLSNCMKVKQSNGNYGLILQYHNMKELVGRSTSRNLSTVESSKMLCSGQVPDTKSSDCVCSHYVSHANGLSSNQQGTEEQEAQVVGLDLLILKAAETLISFAENREYSNQEVESSNNGKDSEDQYEISTDSFERLTLDLEEIKDDANSYSCRQITNETGKDSCGIKLRRGRGMRDFQKDILPGLVSLSRKEICEDINRIQSHPRKHRTRLSRR